MAKGGILRSSDLSPYPSGNKIFNKPIFQYSMVVLILLSLILSIVALVNTYQLKNLLVPKTVSVNDFLKKLTAHNEMKPYVGIAPLNIVQISSSNIANLQAQIAGIDVSYIGNYIIQYSDRIIVYDYDKDQLKGTVSLQQAKPSQLPADFFAKLNKHSELQGLQNQQPVGGQLDQNSLNTLKQQFPEVYANTKAGDFLMRFQTRLIIYDYNADVIVNAVNLS